MADKFPLFKNIYLQCLCVYQRKNLHLPCMRSALLTLYLHRLSCCALQSDISGKDRCILFFNDQIDQYTQCQKIPIFNFQTVELMIYWIKHHSIMQTFQKSHIQAGSSIIGFTKARGDRVTSTFLKINLNYFKVSPIRCSLNLTAKMSVTLTFLVIKKLTDKTNLF